MACDLLLSLEPVPMNSLLARATLLQIEALCLAHGEACQVGAWEESISLLDHARQCAQLAEWAHADPPLVAAAFLHDLGHALAQSAWDESPVMPLPGEPPEDPLLPFVALLSQAFTAEVTEPVRLHDQAKRYLVSADARYAEALTPYALERMHQQGGPMGEAEMRRFEAEPHADAAIRLRLWDDLAKHPGKTAPPLAYYLDLMAELIEAPIRTRKLRIGAFSAA
jgi:predicted HD phosphohydrolase